MATCEQLTSQGIQSFKGSTGAPALTERSERQGSWYRHYKFVLVAIAPAFRQAGKQKP